MVRTWCITPHSSTVHAQQQAQRKIRQLEHAKSKSPARLRSLCPSAPTLRACTCPAGPLQAGSMGPLPHGLLRLGEIRSGGWSSQSTIGVKGDAGLRLFIYKRFAAPLVAHAPAGQAGALLSPRRFTAPRTNAAPPSRAAPLTTDGYSRCPAPARVFQASPGQNRRS